MTPTHDPSSREFLEQECPSPPNRQLPRQRTGLVVNQVNRLIRPSSTRGCPIRPRLPRLNDPARRSLRTPGESGCSCCALGRSGIRSLRLDPAVKTALNTISTDDAYVNGHVTFVAPRVAGPGEPGAG